MKGQYDSSSANHECFHNIICVFSLLSHAANMAENKNKHCVSYNFVFLMFNIRNGFCS